MKKQFYGTLDICLQEVPRTKKVLLLGNFNARVGRAHEIWLDVLDKQGVGKADEICLRLLALCSEHHLTVTNTLFQLKNNYKTTWQHHRSGHWHQLEHIIVRQADRKELPPRKLNVSALKDLISSASLRCKIAEVLSSIPPGQNTLSQWNNLHSGQHEAAVLIIGYSKRINQDCERGNHPIRSSDGNILYKNNEDIIFRWAEYFNLLNQSNPATPNILDHLSNLPISQEMNRAPQLAEIMKAVRELKNNKSPGPNGIPAEIFKEEG
ncbi:uncharacterized protein LOC143028032 [Oratosquilla oratoria]|uniref:uncharacterized protein LOC143028032 n=1 Tax=Oratosquilla oratoria TaxID=337810 RepID=UPI003F759FBB